MSTWISGELDEVQQHAARFIRAELAPRAEQWERDRFIDRSAWAKAAEGGLLCISAPEEFGGGGGTVAHELIVQQELARAGLGGSFGISHSITLIVAHYILAYGTEAQKRRWLPALAKGERIGAIAMTEPGAGSDLQGVRTRAIEVDGGWRLSGQKTFISNGQTADLIFVVARMGEGPGASALSLLAVDAEDVGFGRGRKLEKLGLHAQDTSELFFDDVFVPADRLLGGVPGRGFAQLMSQLVLERMVIALNAVVAMERAVELTVEYLRERHAFGRPIIEFQNSQFVLADAKAQAIVAREFVDALMPRLFAGDLDPATAAAAKLWTTEAAFKLVDACQQLFGGYGYMAEYPIAGLFADVRVMRIYGGTSEIMKLLIARSL